MSTAGELDELRHRAKPAAAIIISEGRKQTFSVFMPPDMDGINKKPAGARSSVCHLALRRITPFLEFRFLSYRSSYPVIVSAVGTNSCHPTRTRGIVVRLVGWSVAWLVGRWVAGLVGGVCVTDW